MVLEDLELYSLRVQLQVSTRYSSAPCLVSVTGGKVIIGPRLGSPPRVKPKSN